MKVLIVEDDKNIRMGLHEILEGEGYESHLASNGREGLDLFRSIHPDFVCLDIMMPEMDGYELCRKIRAVDETVPIIFISAKSEEIDKVLGLELGADDFIMKPFGVREVAARVRAVARRRLAQRSSATSALPFSMGDLEVIPAELRARRGDEAIDLSPRDVKILKVLAENNGRVVDRYALFRAAWGIDHVPNSRTLDQHISQLRKKIETDPKNPKIIRTVHGAGYRYEC